MSHKTPDPVEKDPNPTQDEQAPPKSTKPEMIPIAPGDRSDGAIGYYKNADGSKTLVYPDGKRVKAQP